MTTPQRPAVMPKVPVIDRKFLRWCDQFMVVLNRDVRRADHLIDQALALFEPEDADLFVSFNLQEDTHGTA